MAAPFNFSDRVTLEDGRVLLRALMLADDEFLKASCGVVQPTHMAPAKAV